MSLVVGTEQAIRRQRGIIPVSVLHMSRLSRAQRLSVWNALGFSHSDLTAYCFHVDRGMIVNSIFGNPRAVRKPGGKNRVYEEFHKALAGCFKNGLQTFCARHGWEASGLRVECDSDMVHAVKTWAMLPAGIGQAHELADAVAWFNHRGKAPEGCIEMDVAGRIYGKLLSVMVR